MITQRNHWRCSTSVRGLDLKLFGLVLYFPPLSISLTGCWQQEETEAAGGLLQRFRGASGEKTPPQPPALHLCPAAPPGRCPAGGECYSCLLHPSLIVTAHIPLTLLHQSVSDPVFSPPASRATDQEPSSSLCGGTVNPSSPLLLLMQWRRRSWRGWLTLHTTLRCERPGKRFCPSD